MAILEVEHLKKTYTTRLGSNRVEALKDVNFTVEGANLLQSWANREAEKRRF